MVQVAQQNMAITPLQFGAPPCSGAKCIPYNADFSANAQYDFDFSQQIQGGQIDNIQTAFVDNTLNPQNLVLTINGTSQRIQIAKNTAGYYSLLTPSLPKVSATTTGLVLVYFAFLNFYIPPTVWSAP